MKLIADSGSTKTEWKLMGSTNLQTIFTEGYNPRILSAQQIQDSVVQQLCTKISNLSAINEIHFFGAGCEQDRPKATLKQALQICFPEASIHIQSDMLAACIASSGKKAGICSILGTGSNSCFYDGEKIIEQVPSLGYILGDEGSGNAIGKQIIKDYFYKEMPLDIMKKLEAYTNMNRAHILTEVFEGRAPNRYLASFAKFCATEQNHIYINSLLKTTFSTFFEKNLLKYQYIYSNPCNFIGSIAFYFEPVLTETLQTYQLIPGEFLKSPFPKLQEFFKEGKL
jgi:glucosamine kinase